MKSGVESTGVPTERSIIPASSFIDGATSRARAPYGASKSQGKSGSLIFLLASLWKSRYRWMISIGGSHLACATRRTYGLEESRIDFAVLLPITRNVILIVNSFNGAYWLTGATIDALVRLDVKHPATLINAVNGALLDTGLIFHINAWCGDYVGHGDPFE